MNFINIIFCIGSPSAMYAALNPQMRWENHVYITYLIESGHSVLFGWLKGNIVLFGYLCRLIWVLFFWVCSSCSDLCELRERPIPLFDLVSLAFLCYFLFWEERDIKFEQKYLFTPDFNKGGLRKTNETYLKWVKWHFLNHG